MTGLLNRLYFKETCERFQADGDNGAFLMMDIDWFKRLMISMAILLGTRH